MSFDDPSLDRDESLILKTLSTFTTRSGREIQELTHLSVSRLHMALVRLEERGLIVCERDETSQPPQRRFRLAHNDILPTRFGAVPSLES